MVPAVSPSHLPYEGLFAFETRNPLFSEPSGKGEGQFVKLESREEEEEWPIGPRQLLEEGGDITYTLPEGQVNPAYAFDYEPH